ncbi:bifunctional folylpolyglutamate synthase/dihydrofolate synthase [Candidatus Aerophobetes bacterium]|nr:bifunctional folylpolyglutamate synthase/dihydrofolate synthase [Candidatus Aerophobetes bacterium]
MFSYKQALDYLNSLINYEKKPDFVYNKRLFNLERTKLICQKLGNPHLLIKTIHVAGTKGKGSTSAMVTSILDAAGYRVGLYTSPHLISPRERIRIGNSLITEEEFSYFIFKVKKAVETIKNEKGFLNPTFFEVYTAAAFSYFYHKKVDIAVIEVGLGGRLDATNVILPLVGIITPISIDHTQQLGKDILSIAREKAGIIKPNCKIIISCQKEEVKSLLCQTCQEKKAKFYLVGEDIKFKLLEETPVYQRFDIETPAENYSSLLLSLPGEHQLQNAACAIGAVELLKEHGFKIKSEHIRKGLENIKWPGRLQVIAKDPLIIVDCAHNEASALTVANFLRKFYSDKKIVIVLAVLKNKDVEGIGRALAPVEGKIIITSVKSPRALSPEEIYAKIKRYLKEEALLEKNSEKALKKAKEIAGKDGVICITGSVYLVGEVLQISGKSFI